MLGRGAPTVEVVAGALEVDPRARRDPEVLYGYLTWENRKAFQREASTKNRLHAARYLEYHVKVYHFGWAADFIDDVLLGGAEASTWRIGDRLCTVRRASPSSARFRSSSS